MDGTTRTRPPFVPANFLPLSTYLAEPPTPQPLHRCKRSTTSLGSSSGVGVPSSPSIPLPALPLSHPSPITHHSSNIKHQLRDRSRQQPSKDSTTHASGSAHQNTPTNHQPSFRLDSTRLPHFQKSNLTQPVSPSHLSL